VFNPRLDTAVTSSLGKVYEYMTASYKPEILADAMMLELYGNAEKFFSVMYITEGIEKVFNEVIDALEYGFCIALWSLKTFYL